MPRKPRRHQQLKSWPITFSPFARAFAHTVSMPKRHSESIENPAPSSASNGSTKHPLEERLEGSESSDGEFDVKSLMLYDFIMVFVIASVILF